VENVQPTDECCRRNVLIAVINLSHLALKNN